MQRDISSNRRLIGNGITIIEKLNLQAALGQRNNTALVQTKAVYFIKENRFTFYKEQIKN